MFTRSVSPEKAPDTPTYVEIEFQQGDAVAVDGVALSPRPAADPLNELGGRTASAVSIWWRTVSSA